MNRVRKNITFQDMDKDDAKMMYQSYRLGRLPPKWGAREDMDVMEYLAQLDDFIADNYQFAWSVRDKDKTIGIFFGLTWGANSALIGDTIWHAKVTKRNMYEATIAALDELRKTMVIILRADFKHKTLFDKLMNQKIIRRVGTIYDLEGRDSRQAEYQTRRVWSVM